MTLPVLPLHDMSDRHQGLTRALAESYLAGKVIFLHWCRGWLLRQTDLHTSG